MPELSSDSILHLSGFHGCRVMVQSLIYSHAAILDLIGPKDLRTHIKNCVKRDQMMLPLDALIQKLVRT